MIMGKISVIIPVYNVENYLDRCMQSVINQTYNNLEIILINDGSTDRSSEICLKYKREDKRVIVIEKKNGGLSSARNIGLDNASGDFISFVDSDDWLKEDIYEHSLCLFDTYNCDVVDFECMFTNGLNYAENDQRNIDITLVEGKEILHDYLYKGQKISAPFTVWRKIYKKQLFEGIQFPVGKINEDIATNYRVLSRCSKLIRTSKIGYYYFQNSNSLSRNGLKKRDFDLLDACNELLFLTQDDQNMKLQYLAKIKLARSYFSLLAKIAFFGIEDHELDGKSLIQELTIKVRKNLFLLLRSPMPFNRKLMAIALSINYNFLAVPLNVYKKFV